MKKKPFTAQNFNTGEINLINKSYEFLACKLLISGLNLALTLENFSL